MNTKCVECRKAVKADDNQVAIQLRKATILLHLKCLTDYIWRANLTKALQPVAVSAN